MSALMAFARGIDRVTTFVGRGVSWLILVVVLVSAGNAVIRNQPEVRILRVVVEPGGTRVIHAHDNVDFHIFVPISGPMTFDREGTESVALSPWQPVYLDAGTRHGFRNTGSSAVDIMEIFIQ